SAGRLTLIETRHDLEVYLARRSTDPSITAAFLSASVSHAREGEVAVIDILAAAGFRMIAPNHLLDTVYGGSAHGAVKGGLSEVGRELLTRTESAGVAVDPPPASP